MIELYKDHKKIDFKQWIFPGGEVGVKLQDIEVEAFYDVVFEFKSNNCVFIFLNVCDALKELGVKRSRIRCIMKYVPYARQDRVCSPGESKALDIFIEMLSNAHCSLFCVTDVHSEVTLRLFQEYGIIYDHETQEYSAKRLPFFDTLIAPDKGAENKAKEHVQVKEGKAKLLCLNKTRSVNGVVYDDLLFNSVVGSVCVVDDLCDGGATFLSLAEMLKRTQPKMTGLSLYVTHGLFSKGVEELLKVYDTIYVSNMMYKGSFDTATIILI